MLFGNSDEDWSIESMYHHMSVNLLSTHPRTALSEALKADHGFNPESRAIRDLVEIFADYDAPTRRDCLQFITGSPKLPIGGMCILFYAVEIFRNNESRFPWSKSTFNSCQEASRSTPYRRRLPSQCHDLRELPEIARLQFEGCYA